MKRSLLLVCWLAALPALGASMNFEGHFRAQTAQFSDLSLGAGSKADKSYFSSRALLEPNLVIDDHFSLRSQWSLLTSPGTAASPGTPNATAALGAGQGGYIWGDRASAALVLSRIWLQWTSDFGVLRLGRMPVSWGYGLLYDEGNGVWDNWQSTLDRFDYQLHLGNVIGGLAYSRPNTGNVIRSQSAQEFYTIYLKYDNPEIEVEAGIMYEKQDRKGANVVNAQTVGLSPVNFPATTNVPYPKVNDLVGLYIKKTIQNFVFGGELVWTGGDAFDRNGDAANDSLSALAFLANVSYETSKIKAFVDFLFASGDSSTNDGSFGGFSLLHRNRHAGLILGQELLGAQASRNTIGEGGLFAYGGANVFSGVYLLRPGIRVDWTQDWSTGLEVIWAQGVAGANKNLGVEIDLSSEHQIYKNCYFGINAAYLFGGSAIGGTGGVFLGRGTLGITF